MEEEIENGATRADGTLDGGAHRLGTSRSSVEADP